MTLQILAQFAQIAAPLVAALAAMFSAISSRASVKAARTARESQIRREIADSREARANLQVDIEASATTWPVVLIIKNDDVRHSVRGLHLRIHDIVASGEIIPGAYMRIETGITGPRLAQGNFSGLPEHYRPTNVIAHAPVVLGELDYLDDLELRRWRFQLRILEEATQTPGGIEYSYTALLFGAPQLVNDPTSDVPPLRQRIGLAFQVLRGRG